MAARIYEISHSARREMPYIQAEKLNISKRAISICIHSNSDLFTCDDITFSRESSLGISLVFMYNKTLYFSVTHIPP